jgi:hypothetical protein
MVLTALLWLFEKKWCSCESVRFHRESPVKLSKQLSSFKVVRPALNLLYIVAHVHSILKRHQRKTSRFILDRFTISRLPPDIPRYPASRFPPSTSGSSYMVPHFHLHSTGRDAALVWTGRVYAGVHREYQQAALTDQSEGYDCS